MGSLNSFSGTKALVKWCLVTGDWVTVVSVLHRDRMGRRWEGREGAGCENSRFLHCSGQVSNDLVSYSHNTVSASVLLLWPLSCSLTLSFFEKKHGHKQPDHSLPSMVCSRHSRLRCWPKTRCYFHSLPRGSAWNYINSNEDFGKTSFFSLHVWFVF